MRLYDMTDEETALLILRDRRLKLSLFNEMNDPFELIAVNLQDKYQRQIAKILKSHWVEKKAAPYRPQLEVTRDVGALRTQALRRLLWVPCGR